MPDEILKVHEAVKLAKVCAKTMYDWTKIPGFPSVKIANTIRIPRDLFIAWMEAQAQREA